MPFRPVDVTVRIENRIGVLTAPITYTGDRDTFDIPAGFSTDFTSVPQVCQWLIPELGTYTRAAVLHDFLCTELERLGRSAPADARDTDAIFRRVCREERVPPLRAWLMWAGVRWGALATPSRRPGWWRDAPRVLLVSVLAAPVVVPVSLVCGVGLGVDRLIEQA